MYVLKYKWIKITVSTLIWIFIFPSVGLSCTSLIYKDNNGAPYTGRTMELPMNLPYEVSYFPVDSNFESYVEGHPELKFYSTYSFIAITVPDPINKELKVVEGINDAGMSFSLLSFPGTKGPRDVVSKTRSVLAAVDLGAWVLANFKTVAEVKTALDEQPVLVTSLLPISLLQTPFHYTVHDVSGASIVIEYSQGKQNVLENPIGVMTNGPSFQWHQTNLNNYTFMDNKDQSTLTINGVKLQQPDSGIATVALPSSNTSTGRFIRAVYFSQFAEKASSPDEAILTLSHIMNNFDRPRGITIDERFQEEVENIAAPPVTDELLYTSEYTSWTSMADLERRIFYIRSSNSLNYIHFNLAQLNRLQHKTSVPLKHFIGNVGDVTKNMN